MPSEEIICSMIDINDDHKRKGRWFKIQYFSRHMLHVIWPGGCFNKKKKKINNLASGSEVRRM